MNIEANTQMRTLKILEIMCIVQPQEVIVYYILSYLELAMLLHTSLKVSSQLTIDEQGRHPLQWLSHGQRIYVPINRLHSMLKDETEMKCIN